MVTGVRGVKLGGESGLGTCLTCKTEITTCHLASLLFQQPHLPGPGDIIHGKMLCGWKNTIQNKAQTMERGCRTLRIKLGKYGLR